jgi:hypothetical protein
MKDRDLIIIPSYRSHPFRAAVCALERKGIETNIGNLNRDIKARNRMMNAIRSYNQKSARLDC